MLYLIFLSCFILIQPLTLFSMLRKQQTLRQETAKRTLSSANETKETLAKYLKKISIPTHKTAQKISSKAQGIKDWANEQLNTKQSSTFTHKINDSVENILYHAYTRNDYALIKQLLQQKLISEATILKMIEISISDKNSILLTTIFMNVQIIIPRHTFLKLWTKNLLKMNSKEISNKIIEYALHKTIAIYLQEHLPTYLKEVAKNNDIVFLKELIKSNYITHKALQKTLINKAYKDPAFFSLLKEYNIITRKTLKEVSTQAIKDENSNDINVKNEAKETFEQASKLLLAFRNSHTLKNQKQYPEPILYIDDQNNSSKEIEQEKAKTTNHKNLKTISTKKNNLANESWHQRQMRLKQPKQEENFIL